MSDETKCRECGHLANLHFANGKHPEQRPCWHKDGELFCGCAQLVPATPPTPDPRERGEDEIARRIADEHGIPLRSVLTVIAEVRESDALRAPAPSEAVAHSAVCEHHYRLVGCTCGAEPRRFNPAPAREVRGADIAFRTFTGERVFVGGCRIVADKTIPLDEARVYDDRGQLVGRITGLTATLGSATPDAEGGR